ncbi:MAG: hypothetical protein H6825_04445 [Planctomycetes bacterium]|nr:hypothetical protein [Planctomycetota bacterium]
MPVSPLVRSLPLALLLVTCLVGCGGGGGGGGSGQVQAGGGGDPLGGKFGAVDGPTGAFLPGLNSTVVVVFNKKIKPSSVTAATLNVVTITDPAGQATAPGGVLASYDVEVADNRLLIVPTVEFSQEDITFGFVAQALFEISFSSPDSGASIESVGGQPIANPSKSFFFRTPSDAIDKNPGFPEVRAWFVDDTDAVTLPDTIVDEGEDGSLYDDVIASFTGVEEILPPSPAVQSIDSSPVRDAIFVFNDAILPQTVLNPIDGSSPSVRVLINTVTPPAFAPIISPAQLTFLHQQDDLTIVRWRSSFAALPPGAFLIYEVTAGVEDLGGNSKLSITGDGSPSFSALVVVDGTVDPMLYSLTEPFDDDVKENVTQTSAAWADLLSGYLVPVRGGGRGLDGSLVIDPLATAGSPGATSIPLAAVIDYDARRVSLPTVRQIGAGVFEPRTWELTRLVIPDGWTLAVLTDRDGDGTLDPDEFVVQSPGHPLDGDGSPLEILCTETIDVSGTVTVAGADADDVTIPTGGFGTFFGRGGNETASGGSGGAGGRGGDSLLSVDTDDDGEADTVSVALVSPPVDAAALPFEAAVSKRLGVTGRSTSLSATQLVDELKDLSVINTDPELAAMLAAGELRLQPNVGIGSTLVFNSGTTNQVIDENHPTFVIESVSVSGVGATTITIKHDDGESMVAASDNIGNGYAPIAAAGDSYLVGRFAGADGGDPSGQRRGGHGAEPFLVVNEGAGVTTTGGGGGGGGGIYAGFDGGDSGPASDPTLNQRGVGNGITNGMALDESGGASGGLGALRGTVVVIDDVTLDLVSATSGTDPAELAGAALVGSRIVPGAPDDGWIFRIASFDGTTFVVEPVEASEGEIVLTTGPAGAAGPGLTTTEVVPFLVLPPAGVGGSGGGGTGASITGTLNVAPSKLPTVTPGAAGGAGGGALRLESARDVVLRNGALLSARGGSGGEVVEPSLTYAGGGGGGGGSVSVSAAQSVSLFQGAALDAGGGSGAGFDAFGLGGDGGDGWVRVETADDSLAPDDLEGFTFPAARGENVGRFVGLPQGVGVSRFYNVGVANPDYESVLVTYRADTDGDDVPEEPLTWMFDASGADGGPEGYTHPPFRLQFNPTGVNEAGQQDGTGASPTYYESYDLVSARTGLAYDAGAGVLLYSVGEDVSGFHLVDSLCLGTGCDQLPLSTIPDVGDTLDIVSVAFGGVDGEIFMLQRGTGRVIVLDGDSAAYLRSIQLPAVLEGGMTVLSDGVDPEADRLLVAANREDLLVTFSVRDPDAITPETTDYQPATFLDAFGVTRDGDPLEDIELTGLSYDPATERVWCVDAPTGTVFEIDVSDGNEGTSTTGVHAFAKLLNGASGTVLSSIAYDGATVWVVRSVDVDQTTLIALDPADLMAGEYALPGLGAVLPETAKSIGDGDVFLRFRLAIDGTFVDETHPGGAVAFRHLAVDEVEFSLRNASF